MRMSDWSSDVCSSDLVALSQINAPRPDRITAHEFVACLRTAAPDPRFVPHMRGFFEEVPIEIIHNLVLDGVTSFRELRTAAGHWEHANNETVTWIKEMAGFEVAEIRSEEHTSELQSLMRISYAVFCLKTKKKNTH